MPQVHRFSTLREYSHATGQDVHSVVVDYDTFVHVTMPDKSDPQRLYSPDGLDFRLSTGSPAIDGGIFLPSINDDFTGKAPDIGGVRVREAAAALRPPMSNAASDVFRGTLLAVINSGSNKRRMGRHTGSERRSVEIHRDEAVAVRLTRKYAEVIDGIDLSGREVGDHLCLGRAQARLLIAEGWAEPASRRRSDVDGGSGPGGKDRDERCA